MAKKPEKLHWDLKTSRANDTVHASKLANEGDIGSIIAYLIDCKPNQLRYLLDGLREETHHKFRPRLVDLMKILLHEYQPQGVQVPRSFSDAVKAVIAKKPEEMVAYLQAHPEDLNKFCNLTFDLITAGRLAIAAISAPEKRDAFDLTSDVIRYLLEHHRGHVQAVRGRVTTLMDSTERYRREEESMERKIALAENLSACVMSGHPMQTKLHFGRVGTELKLLGLKEDLVFQAKGEGEEEWREDNLKDVGRVLGMAGVSFKVGAENKLAKTPGWLVAEKEDVNKALHENPPRLILRKTKEHRYVLEMPGRAFLVKPPTPPPVPHGSRKN